MSLNKKIILAVVLVLLVAFISIPAFLMFRGINKFGSAKNELDMTVRSLRSFYDKNPFPSQVNIKKEKENLSIMHEWFEKLLNRLVRGQIEVQESTPTSFMTKYSDIHNKTIQKANKSIRTVNGDKATKVLDDDNPLGFDYYAGGELPAPEDVPRLTQQLLMIEKLSTILINGKVKKIVAINREKFDSGGAAKEASATIARRRERRGFAAAQQNSTSSQRETIRKTDVYEVQEFTLEFKAKEDIAMDVFNRLAQNDMFIVIKSIEFDKQGPDLHMPDMEVPDGKVGDEALNKNTNGIFIGANKTVKKSTGIPIRQQRRVSGPSIDIPMDITVKVDVYTFLKDKIKDKIKDISRFSG